MGDNFKSLKEQIVSLNGIIRNPERFYAHKTDCEDSAGEVAPELLSEHVDRCVYYFEKLYNERNLGDIFNAFFVEFMGAASDKIKRLFEKMLINVIVFHDIGKMNPEFQKIKMKNQRLKINNVQCLNGTRHALLSSAVYIDYFSQQISDAMCSKKEMEILHVIMLANAYVISRHHTNLSSFESYLTDDSLYCIFNGFKEGQFSEIYCGPFYNGTPELVNLHRKNNVCIEHFYKDKSEELALYTYVRLLFSVLVSCDYYATTEYENGVEIKEFGNISDIIKLRKIYEQTDLMKGIREFSFAEYKDDGRDINILRKCMFYEAEEMLEKNKEEGIFYIEAPTGGGKSNIGLNCSFRLLNDKIRRIFYVYPFNTLVEQNMETMRKLFGDTDVYSDIAVVNSLTPIKIQPDDEDNSDFYHRALLDRQFLNYPIILTTHVNLFDIMFGSGREAAVSFYQLSGSVIVLDEIQSYKNTIWTEIMKFLEYYSRLLNIKFIIMSATLPQLDYLTGNNDRVVNLICNRQKYFEDARFKSRVKISYELLDSDGSTDEESLLSHICENAGEGRKILVEFIKKRRAESFYHKLLEQENDNFDVMCMTGDDNMIDRKRIIRHITNERTERGVVLIATQVVEAGVDIDMDIGYKDISKLDSEEQFMGRINRNFKRDGKVYFFNMDDSKKIYNNDFRLNNELTLMETSMRTVLGNKDFHSYYSRVLELLKSEWNNKMNENGLGYFNNAVKKMDFPVVSEHMRLIEDNRWDISVYIARTINDELDGKEIWKDYRNLLTNQNMNYAEKQIRLSEVRSKMNYFIYSISRKSDINYSECIGELYYIEDDGKYFENGRLNKELFMSQGAIFIDI